jgi:hypothetical protein
MARIWGHSVSTVKVTAWSSSAAARTVVFNPQIPGLMMTVAMFAPYADGFGFMFHYADGFGFMFIYRIWSVAKQHRC